ncbi:hypothetical protein BDN72DRAFT_850184 [Pluteus cervinus]|uniref:Uncharacterized protein n=1 Tax=Pluteus cervinus TaxID=181527 RepID=A0ACD3A4U6_9AGAR|nr:hypothetical protein BDN72DRAFT_850184 [Pluteus cervinus]
MPLSISQAARTQQLANRDVAFAKIDKKVAILKERICTLASTNKDVTALKERIRSLHADRNTFNTIHEFPPEVLSRILYLARHVPSSDWNYYGKSHLLRWFAVSRVSQSWRDIALSSTNLWSHLASTYPKRIFDECLRLSKSGPLQVDLYRISPHHTPHRFFPSHLNRIQELTLKLSTDEWDTFAPNLSSPAPLLESFFVALEAPGVLSPPPLTITDRMFSGTTPRIRRLHLSACSIDIKSSLFTDLTSLELLNPLKKVSAKAFLIMLRQLPRLTLLAISDVLKPSTALVPSKTGIIALTSLQSLSIEGQSFHQDLDILSHLSFPANSTLKFHSKTGSTAAVHSLLEFLRVNKAARMTSSTPLSYSMDLYSSYNTLKLSLNNDCTEPGYVADLLKFDLRGGWADKLQISNNPEIAVVFSYLHLTTLTSLTSNWHLDTETWTKLFGPLPNLKEISANTQRSIGIIHAIMDDFKAKCPPAPGNKLQNKTSTREKKKEKGGRGGGQSRAQVASTSGSQAANHNPIFPNLEVLKFNGPTYYPWAPDDLVTALRARKTAGKGLKLLEIAQCENMNQTAMDALSEVVTVNWDGFDGDEDWQPPELYRDYVPTSEDMGFSADFDYDKWVGY